MLKTIVSVNKQARELEQGTRNNRVITQRCRQEISRIEKNATRQFKEESQCVPALNLARRASEVFENPEQLKLARASYDFVISIGGVDKVRELKKKSEAIQEGKLADSESDDEILFVKERTREERDREGQLSAIWLE